MPSPDGQPADAPPVGGRRRVRGARVLRRGLNRWRIKNWPLRSKLVAVLLIPTLTALVLIGMRFASLVESGSTLDQLSARVSTEQAVAALVHVLQRERDLTVHYVVSGRTDDAELHKQRTRVDSKIGAFGKTLAEVRPELPDGAAETFDALRDRLGDLRQLRYGADHASIPTDAVLRSFGGLVDALLSERERSVDTIVEPELVRLQMAGMALSRAKDQKSVARAVVDEALHERRLAPDRRRLLHGALAEVKAAEATFRKFAAPQQQRMYDDTVTGMVVDDGNDVLEKVLVLSERGKPLDVGDRELWDSASTYTINLTREVEHGMLVLMRDATDALASKTKTAAMRDGAIVGALLLIALLIAWLISRSLLRPLRTLRGAALEVAEYRLPAAVHGLLSDPNRPGAAEVAPVPVTGSDEVGQVARAFDAVHGEAVRLAAEQAELRRNVNAMFVNLSRRGQELAHSQLKVIDEMEATEQDPDLLARLFELDHFATRLRRICENLLVITGNDISRPAPGPVAASEVLAAALSEVENYQRVDLGPVPEVGVVADAVGDIVHVISELLENATSVSDAPVTVVSSVKSGGAWLVEITDGGQGMSAEAIELANARLADPPDADVEATRHMGLYVVARLARRNGLAVRLRPAADGGVTASVLVPAELILQLVPRADPETARRRESATWPALGALSRPTAQDGGIAPPRRAPIIGTPVPAVADEPDGPHPFEDDQPTERLPVYRDLLSKWFRTPDDDRATDGYPPAELRDLPPLIPERPAPEPFDPPTVRTSRPEYAAIGVNSDHDDGGEEIAEPADPPWHAVDPADPNGFAAAVAELTAEDPFDLVKQGVSGIDVGLTWGIGTEVISRAPQDVRRRMAELVDGRRRARQDRGGE